MYEKFGEYMYYLLTAPYKKVIHTKNQWYIFFKVIGKLFDKNKEALFKAREETMVATATDLLLIEHARDRGLSRYADESTENFRIRIAMYEEICRKAGSNEGIRLAVKALGYKDVKSVPYSIIDGNIRSDGNIIFDGSCVFDGTNDFDSHFARDRWAEFYVMIAMNVDDSHPISFSILKNVVRKIKNVGGKDNYRFIYDLRFNTEIVRTIDSKVTNRYSFNWWDIKLVESTATNRIVFDNSMMEDFGAKVTIKDNLWYFDGSYSFDGTMLSNAVFKEECL